jgi:hypothetical protein
MRAEQELPPAALKMLSANDVTARRSLFCTYTPIDSKLKSTKQVDIRS